MKNGFEVMKDGTTPMLLPLSLEYFSLKVWGCWNAKMRDMS